MHWLLKLETFWAGNICKGLRRFIFYNYDHFSKMTPTYVKKHHIDLLCPLLGYKVSSEICFINEEWINRWDKMHYVCIISSIFFPQLFVQTLFDYNPNEDPAIPCKDAAVTFNRGDVLQIVSMDDNVWWQACHLGDCNNRAGLIPSQQLHERWPIIFWMHCYISIRCCNWVLHCVPQESCATAT